ncbi:MAG TPA: sulfatase-like hydrolase/transferase, partial [Chitinophagaceae bacterium]|nr:sulfatase-like hydrolase/transferase [Chitinophagaceae bacterium]
ALGLDDNTIIMFSSDNGATFAGGVDAKFFNSVAGLRGLKMDLYEGGIREPFIVRWPGKVKPGTVSDHISAQYDVFATVAELTGQKIKKTDGISFLPELFGKKQKIHEFLYFEYPEKGGQVAIRMGKWKAVKTNLRKIPAAPWELYDLETDRSESIDVAASHPQIIEKINVILKREHQTPAADVPAWRFVDDVIRQMK